MCLQPQHTSTFATQYTIHTTYTDTNCLYCPPPPFSLPIPLFTIRICYNCGFIFCSAPSLSNLSRLHTGWSTGKSSTASLEPAERDAIIAVIQRNEQLEIAERQRVGRLVERVEKIKQRAAECGPKNCRSVNLSLYHIRWGNFFHFSLFVVRD